MKTLIMSLIAACALCANAPNATASSHDKTQATGVAAQQSLDLSSRHRHWRRAHYHRVAFAPRRYRYAYRPVIYPRPYYGYAVRRPYCDGSYAWGPAPYVSYGGYRPFYGGPWSGFMMGLGYGW